MLKATHLFSFEKAGRRNTVTVIENESKTSDVTLAIGDCKLFCAHRKVKQTNTNYTFTTAADNWKSKLYYLCQLSPSES